MHKRVILSAILFLGLAPAAKAEQAHLASPVIFTRYEEQWPQVVGTEVAAILVTPPFTCPAGHPHEGGECAHIRFLTTQPSDPENGDGIHCSPFVLCPEMWVFTGMDWRMAVWHDPEGKAERSWHLWGEKEGEKKEVSCE